ncbi:hypothetical protein ACIBL3_02470 [Kribbella sp. NPDC050124]|uniref:hypothetical protein n=1 Tax=Kribbella sp. NPDC050124 TaxID=3364114 RepID=UPI0037BCDEF3
MTPTGTAVELTAGVARRLARGVAWFVAVVVLVVPSGSAVADDDPAPVPWPSIGKPEAGGGGQGGPAPISWPSVTKPEDTGSSSNPAPVQWPAPAKTG